MEDDIQKKVKEILNDSIKVIENYNGKLNDIYSLSHKKEQMNLWQKTKTKFSNITNIVKFNYFGWSSKNTFQKANIFHHRYDLNNDSYHKRLESLIYFSYRSNFSPIFNTKNKAIYTSDSGWGCMIRSSQMILAKALYRHYKFKLNEKLIKKDINDIKMMVLVLFLDCSLTGFKYYCCDMIDQYLSEQKNNKINHSSNHIYEITPPFSLRTICSIGELYNKTAGEWYSDITMPKIFHIINNNFKIIPQCEIINFISMIDHHTIISKCFKEIEIALLNAVLFKEKYYKYHKAGIIFISVHLGLTSIPMEYYDSIKALFDCKQCIGIIGGQGVYGYYFIGYDEHHFLYLNPHCVQQCVQQNADNINVDTYNITNVNQLAFNQMQTAFTIGFQFRSIDEYNLLIHFFKEETAWKYPVFKYTETVISISQLKDETISFINHDTALNDF